jgi:lipid II:glycine glycyltransferase (peptidoglycan interpeptide bridge formation enzyme)
MHIRWNVIQQSEWEQLQAPHITALQQDWAYGASFQAMGLDCHRAQVIKEGKTIALAQFICRRYLGVFGVALCTRGPVWLEELSALEQQKIYRELKRSCPLPKPRWLIFSPSLTEHYHPSLVGLTRVMTGYSTVLVDLTQTNAQLRAACEGRWRNRLVAAERENLEIVRNTDSALEIQWLLEEERTQRLQKNFHGLPTHFIEHYHAARADPSTTLLMLHAESNHPTPHKENNHRIAAMLFLLHGSTATYHVGWTNAEGRAKHAHNLLMWRAFEELRTLGIHTLDLGGINTRSLAGISRFKIGTGGQIVTYAGTYV